MKLTFLGTGTSCGVPFIGCDCEVCRSTDPHDKRLRASALVTLDNGRRLLIDCGPDFRQQILACGSPSLDAVLLTHIHYDHVGGLDDMRPYAYGKLFPVYCRADVARNIRTRLPYCFAEHPYPGVPSFNLHVIDPEQPFTAVGVDVEPLPVMHGRMPIVGFRIGPLAYITDCLTMPDETLDKIRGVDTLVINALRIKPHMSHMNLQAALDVIKSTEPRQAFLTHMSHDIGLHAAVSRLLPEAVSFAYDGLTVTIPE